MLLQNIKSSIKRIARNKLYSIINIGGLALSFAIAILILLYVHNELNVDTYHKNLNNLFRLVDNKSKNAYTPATFGEFIINKYPEVKYVSQYFVHDAIFQYGNNKSVKVENLAYADSSFLDMFSINILKSKKNELLTTNQSIIISQKTAKKLFGDTDPLGQIMRFENTYDYVVEGVFEDYPSNSSFKHDVIANFPSVKYLFGYPEYDVMKDEGNGSFSTFIMLYENVNKHDLNERIKKDFSEKRFWEGSECYLQEFSDIYFNNTINDDYVRHGNKQVTLLFLSIALIIIVIAMINYINLSTSISAKRALSIGIYKTLGAHRKNLIVQFMLETLNICMLALILGFILAELFIPVFNNMLQYNLQVKTFYAFPFNMISLLCILTIAVISGLYPAFYLTKLSPLQVLKAKFVTGKGIGLFKKALMVFQFIVTIVLITGTIVVYKQLNYWHNMDFGIDKDYVISINLSAEMHENASVFSERVSKIPSVEDICFSSITPGSNIGGLGFRMDDRVLNVRYLAVDANYMDFYGIDIIEGEGFSKGNPEINARKFLLNETAAKYMACDNLFEKEIKVGRCIGVFKDYIYMSQKDAIKPLLILFGDKESKMSIKLSPIGMPETLKQIEEVWNSMTLNFPFEYKFINELFATKYKNEERLTKLLGYFAIFSIFIACLGLFGLISFMAEQRTKEIGIRKANGANIKDIILLFSKEFIQLILISGIIAIPLSNFILSKWLQNFAYATKLSWWIFAVSIIIAIVVSSLSVFYRAYRAASQNPTECLRYE
ncbi:MAG: ABC transporter permease [Bacteroidetes bacterium]|nr:ABC transporter permease [Bacteroidota bacterium]